MSETVRTDRPPYARTRSRRATHATLVGLAAGMLVAGLIVPFALGERTDATGLDTLGTSPPGPRARLDEDGQGGDGAERRRATATTDVGTGPEAGAAPAMPGPGGSGSARTVAAAPASTAPGTRTASDVGITPTTIRLGFLILEVGSIGEIGIAVPGVEPEKQQAAWQALVEEINTAGGINGRTIQPVYRRYDVLSHDDMRSACLYMTEDAKVFAVLDASGFYGGAVLCVTEEHRTPLLGAFSQGIPTGWFDRAGRMLFSLFQGGDRLMRNYPTELDRLGALDGKTLGILANELPGQHQTVDILERTLGELGHEVAHRSNLSADLNTAASQVPVEVQRMRTKGVDAVVITTGTVNATQFVQTADSQGWRPDYFVSDWLSASNDVFAQNMPASFDGTLAVTVTRVNEEMVGIPQPAYDAECERRYENGTRQPVERGENMYGIVMYSCSVVDLWAAAARATGPELTRSALSQQLQQLQDFAVGQFGGANRFAPGKFSAGDAVRTTRWNADCRCWLPLDDFRPTRF